MAQPRRQPLVERAEAEPRGDLGLARLRLLLTPGHDPAEERGLHCAHDEAVARGVVEEVADSLVLGRGQLAERAAAADLDEEEELPDRGAGLGQEPRDRRQLLGRVAHHDGVHLDGDAVPAEAPDRRQGRLEVAGDAAHALVRRRGRAVEADRGDPDAGAVQLGHALVAEQRRDAWRERDRHLEPRCPGEQRVELAALEHVAAGGDQHRAGRAEAGQRVEERLRLRLGQLTGQRLGDGRGAAVAAGEYACPRRLPEDEDRAAVEIEPRGLGRGCCGDCHAAHTARSQAAANQRNPRCTRRPRQARSAGRRSSISIETSLSASPRSASAAYWAAAASSSGRTSPSSAASPWASRMSFSIVRTFAAAGT